MARLNQEQRADVQQYARQLVSSGTSRRRMDSALREYSFEKYGIRQSIGKTTHSRLFQQRLSEIMEREEKTQRGYISPRKKYQTKYNHLLRQHFLSDEAKLLLSRLTKINTNELKGMAEQRRILHSKFLRKAAEENYSPTQFRRKWREAVKRFYIDNRNKWVKDWLIFHRRKGDRINRGKKMGFNAIWDWYGYIKEQLPPDSQSDTPRKHRRKPQEPPTVDEFRVSRRQKRQERIRNLQAQLDKATSPSMRQWLKELMEKERTRKRA